MVRGFVCTNSTSLNEFNATKIQTKKHLLTFFRDITRKPLKLPYFSSGDCKNITKPTLKILKKKNLPLQDRQQKHVSCTALVMNNNSVLAHCVNRAIFRSALARCAPYEIEILQKVLRYRLAKVLTSYCTCASRNTAKCSRWKQKHETC